MLLLTTVNDSLVLTTAYAGSVDWSASYADITTSAFTPGSGQGNVTAAMTTTIVAAPSAATQRQVKLLSLRNAGTSDQTVTVKKLVSGIYYAVTPDVMLAAGETLYYLDGKGFSVLDPFGQSKMAVDAAVTNFPDSGEGAVQSLLWQIIGQQRVTNFLLKHGLNISVSVDTLRDNME